MRRRSTPLLARPNRPAALIMLGLISLVSTSVGAETKKPPESSEASFSGQITPLLAKYCINCHGDKKPKGGVNLAKLTDEASLVANQKVWQLVIENIESGDMPPEGKPRPSKAEVELLTGWIDARLEKLDCGKESDPGRVTLRRLNRSEYNNTIRDLFGRDFRAAEDFPSDDVGYGFDNIGDVLTLPPILMEQYLAAAESIVEQAIVADSDSSALMKTWEAEELEPDAGGSRYDDWARMLASTGEIAVTFPCPRGGEYLFRVRAFGQQAGPEPARMAFQVDGKVIKTVEVTAEVGNPEVYEVKLPLSEGARRLSVAFINDFYEPKAEDPKRRDRNLVVDFLEIQGTAGAANAPLPASHQKIIFQTPTKATRDDCVRAILERFASRAYRRPITPGELARLVKFVDLAEQSGDSFERGIQLALEAVLVSPQFLFRVEIDPRLEKSDKTQFTRTHPINEFELASRLSYFLYSSIPDDELWQLATEGKLREGDHLEKQVRRMLLDPKAKALVENFADQWLQIRNLKTVNPDPKQFPKFDEPLRAAMLKETELFFEAVMREDRSVLDFLDADYTFLNERLAAHYGINGVKGNEFRRVSLSEGTQRGGLLTQASILTVTSNPTRTSPVKRGKWILEQILGTPPPPPPPDVPELKEDPSTVLTGSLRQRMEQHRANPSCASCHARMDPLGFAFENFDAIGAWRDKDGAFPVDSSGSLPSGQSFQGPEGLKAILKTREKNFTRCLAEKMLTFAIGRGIEDPDKCAIDKIVDTTGSDQSKFSRLVLEIVKSDPFQKRKNRGAGR
ncbi:Planctomycete cytochrome C [Singulisphaera sp. GP187]|uniref:DUF1592 domain-containing protein n=1 Tax=Singulisphaera sp. GP187 TaxID=1882752 RepID=UPI00092A8F5E|nr:DUF1592 domain-containing protein [Singulisphaera sp. GP187]SIO07419.1 Planctomycete cytochrome C [Singulisphaera sp. GP187]